ncbi:hypothetical protein L5F09_02120 [Aliarcobacter butzleri]|uniref:YobI family P-loop NTPase n=1 Tax=Aliarcobacter butzleri TaxID=28197 RepID=UPI001EDBAC7E|nr:hypothetical protein [Aliarcobacter butzleri]MCG3664544.1 hypothetical protein [Aliarcobacter butzleri]
MQEEIIECKNILENLTPTDNVQNNGIYECSLKHGIDDKNIKNVALAGSYGSGKSSILKTFEKKYKNEYNFLNISLADFSGSEKNSENLDIERSILQKMFYTVKSEEIPFSRFKRIKDITAQELQKYSLWLFIGLFWFFIAYKNKNLPEYLSFLKFDIVYIIGFIITFIGLYFMLPKIISLFGNIDLKKINLKSGDVDLGQKEDSSILNKNLDEILYFFKATNYDVVIFEDLDRYAKNIDIFVKLREINLILNNSKEVEQNITFIYAIKDDNFKDEERTKFFDLIIPVIPIVDYSNSSEQLKIMIKKHKENMRLNKNILENNFINDICLYIDNMRLLKNIFNEFVIYNEKLESNILKKDKLFSMIVYKNLFPDDFSKLSNKKGLVYDVLSKKEKLIDSKIKSIDEKINDIKNKLEEIDSEQIKSIDELRSIYIYHVLKNLERIENHHIYVDDSYINIPNLLEEDNFNKLKNSSNIKYESYARKELVFENLQNEISNKTYDERETLIKNKNEEYRNKLSLKIESLEKEKQAIKIKKLKDLIENTNDIFGKKFNNKGLLIFLITNGYIDETYSYYISHFYEESITKDDRDFILSIRERRAKDYSFKLEKIDEILMQIHEYEYSRKEILNYSLIEYLLEKNNTKILNQIIKQINEKKDLDFIKGYIDLEYKYLDKFIDFIIEKSTWIWDEIEKSSFPIEKKENYLKLILKYGKIENLKNINISLVSEFISNINNFVQFSNDIDIKKIKDVLKIFEPAFKKVSQIDDKTELFEFIYKNSFYEISFEMIEGILKEFNKNEFNLEDLDKKNLTIIKNSSCKELITDIEKNIAIYIENILLNFEKIYDDENILVELLNNEKISDDLKLEIIKKQETLISNISEIEDSKLWKSLFEENKVKVDWNNILYYYQQYKELDESLLRYINLIENAQILSVTRINSKTDFMKNSKFDIKLVKELLDKILLTNEIDINSYKLLIKSNGYIGYSDLDISNLSEEKIIEIVKEGKLQLSIQNFNSLKKYTKEQHIKLIEKNIDEFLEKYDEYKLDEKDILKILESLVITKKVKIEIIQKLDVALICDKNIGKQIYNFMDKKVKYSIDFLENLIQNLNATEMQVNVIVEQNQYLSEDEFIQLLNLLNNEYSSTIKLDGKRPKLDSNYYNKKLIEILKERKFITDSKEDEKNKVIRLFLKNKK